MNKLLATCIAAAAIALSSCTSHKNIVYMQDQELNKPTAVAPVKDIRVRPGDEISITVTSKDMALAAVFNPYAPMQNGSSTGALGSITSGGIGAGDAGGGAGSRSIPYMVDKNGNIDFPVLGEIHVAGKTREEIAKLIQSKIKAGRYLEDPRVQVLFYNLHYTMLGEVNSPGEYQITNDHVTIVDAIANAGDLNILGKRDRIFVTRVENGERTTYQVDMRTVDLYNSPVYYLQQDDVVYVEPSKWRTAQSNANESSFRNWSTWVSVATMALSLALLIKNI